MNSPLGGADADCPPARTEEPAFLVRAGGHSAEGCPAANSFAGALPEERLHDIARRALERCGVLGGFSEEPGRLTRTFLSPPMHAVHARLAEWMAAAGMAVRVDALGSIVGRYAAQDGTADAPALLLGSHLDTVPDAGRYDGVLGVLLGLAAVESLGGRPLPFAVDVIGFSEEEGVRFRPYLGSLAAAGRFEDALLGQRDAAGVTVAQAITTYGLDPKDIPAAAYDPACVLGYLEAHIEQGPVLEARGLSLGVVSAIVGQSRLRLRLTGRAGHAGTTPMADRRDALAGAAEFTLAVEAQARAVPGLTGTVGTARVVPGAANVIPGVAEVSLDVRHADDATRRQAVAALRARAQQIGAARGLTCEVVGEAHEEATPMDPALRARLARAIGEAGLPVHALVSGAGHDAVVMARMTPAAMLFLRSPGGLSHHPDERVLPEDVAAGVTVLHRFLRLTAQEFLERSGGERPR